MRSQSVCQFVLDLGLDCNLELTYYENLVRDRHSARRQAIGNEIEYKKSLSWAFLLGNQSHVETHLRLWYNRLVTMRFDKAQERFRCQQRTTENGAGLTGGDSYLLRPFTRRSHTLQIE